MPAKVLVPFLAAVGLALASGWPLILLLRRLKAGQHVSLDAPERHREKAGTPTMGGAIILAPALTVTLLLAPPDEPVAAVLALTLAFTALGFLDDYLIVRRGKNLGLKARQKLFGQFLFAIGFVAWFHTVFRPAAAPGLDGGDLERFAWQAFQVLLIVGMSNAVNLTDGLDGLAAGVAFPVWIVLALLGVYAGGVPVAAARGMAELSAAFAGAALGYLWFNAHPAQVFMGDTGSLPLGAALAGAAIMLEQEWVLLLAAGVYVIEAGSVTLQVLSFKTTGRRILRMSPLHHHFELAGWPETRVVSRFTIASVLLCAIALWIVLGSL